MRTSWIHLGHWTKDKITENMSSVKYREVSRDKKISRFSLFSYKSLDFHITWKMWYLISIYTWALWCHSQGQSATKRGSENRKTMLNNLLQDYKKKTAQGMVLLFVSLNFRQLGNFFSLPMDWGSHDLVSSKSLVYIYIWEPEYPTMNSSFVSSNIYMAPKFKWLFNFKGKASAWASIPGLCLQFCHYWRNQNWSWVSRKVRK